MSSWAVMAGGRGERAVRVLQRRFRQQRQQARGWVSGRRPAPSGETDAVALAAARVQAVCRGFQARVMVRVMRREGHKDRAAARLQRWLRRRRAAARPSSSSK